MKKLEKRKDRDVLNKVSGCREKNPGIMISMEISTGEFQMNEPEMELFPLQRFAFIALFLCATLSNKMFFNARRAMLSI